MIDTGELKRDFKARAEACGLKVECEASGSANAEIMIVGEWPGPREVSANMGMVGPSGNLLWDGLRPHGITRNQVYLTNIVKRRVEIDPRTEKAAIYDAELDHWIALFRDLELNRLPNLKYVLVLGSTALKAVLGLQGIAQWRGSVIPDGMRSVLVAYNPAYILRMPQWELIFRFDLAKLKRLIDGKHKQPEIEAIINPSPQEAIQWIDKMQDEKLPVSFDIETMAGETACIGLANDVHRGMCINYRSASSNRYDLVEELSVRQRLQSFFADPGVRLVAQNGNFDSYWLYCKDRIRPHAVWFDTMLAHHLLYPTFPHNLGFLTTQYTDHPYYKDEKDSWREGGNIDGFWEYNVKDVCITLAVSNRLRVELKNEGMERFFFEHIMALQPHLVNMTANGVQIDVRRKATLGIELGAQVDELRREFVRHARDATNDGEYECNPNSPTQLKKLFFIDLKLVGRGTSTDDENRRRMYEHHRTSNAAKSMLDKLALYKEHSKFLSTYVESSIDDDGRIRCEWKQTGTQSAPGRLSSSKVMWGTGMNLQNQPVRARSMFIAPPGYRFIYFDMSQAEARVVAWLADIPKWKEQFERARMDGSYDCHRALASEMWGIPYEEVPEKDEIDGKHTIRYIAKRCRHGLNYRMGYERLATVTGLSLADARRAYEIYHRVTPELRRWWDSCITRIVRDRKLVTSFGRRLIVTSRLPKVGEQSQDAESLLTSIVAFEPQSTIGDRVCEVIHKSTNDSRWRPEQAAIALNIHDALIAITLDDDEIASHHLRIMKEYAEAPLNIRGEQLIIPAECAWSKPDEHGVHRWSTIEKIKKFK